MKYSLSILFLICACTVESTSHPPSPALRHTEGGVSWTPPLVIGNSAKDLFINPCLAVSDETLFVIGSTVLHFTGESAPSLHMAEVARKGGVVTKSVIKTSASAQIPRCALDLEKVLHVIWAEIDPRATFDPDSPMYLPVLTAASFHDDQWASSLSHHYGLDVNWSESHLVEGPQKAFYAATTYRGGDGSGITLIRFDTNARQVSWKAKTLFIYAAYPQIGFSAKGDRLLSYVAGAWADSTTDLKSDVNSVFFDNLDDGRDSVLVSRSGMRPANYLRMAVTDNDRIHLIWLRAPEGTDGSNLWGKVYTYHTFSADGGVTWTTPAPISPLLEGFIDLHFTARPGGGLHLIIDAETSDYGGTLYYLSYDGTAWSDAEPVFESGFAAEPAIAVTDDGALHLFTNYLPPNSPIDAYRPVYLSRPPQP